MSAGHLVAAAVGALVVSGCAAPSTEVTWNGELSLGETRAFVGLYTVSNPGAPSGDDEGDALYASAYVQSEPAGAWVYNDVPDDSCGSIALPESTLIPFPGGPPHVQVAGERLQLDRFETVAGPQYFAASIAPSPDTTVAFSAADVELAWPERLVLMNPERLLEPSESDGRIRVEWEPPAARPRRRGPATRIHIDGFSGETLVSCRLHDDGEALLPAAFMPSSFDYLAVGRIVDVQGDLGGVPLAFIAARLIEVPIP